MSAQDREVLRAALDRSEVAARRTGIDRRRFLQTSAGVAAVLSTFEAAACGGRDRASTPAPTSSTAAPTTTATTRSPRRAGGTRCPSPRTSRPASRRWTRRRVHLRRPHPPRRARRARGAQNAPRIADMILGLVPAGCAEADPYRCVDRIAYLHDMFLASDTTMALLSDVPELRTARRAGAVGGEARDAAARRRPRRRRRAAGPAPRRDRPELRRPRDAPRRDGRRRSAPATWPPSRCTRRGDRAGRATPSTTRPSASPSSSRRARSA